jgi:hypothetical protein
MVSLTTQRLAYEAIEEAAGKALRHDISCGICSRSNVPCRIGRELDEAYERTVELHEDDAEGYEEMWEC